MTKVELLDSFNTSNGTALLVITDGRVKVGDTITDGKKKYQVKGIEFLAKPTSDDRFIIKV